MLAWGRLDHRTLEATSQPSSFFLLFFASFVLPPWPSGLAFLHGFWQLSEVYPMALLDYCSMSLRTQAWPAIEFVSGKEGLRPRVAVFAGITAFMPYDVMLRVLVFFEIVHWDTLMFAVAPGLSGGRGEMAMAVASPARFAFLRGAVCAFPTVHQMLSLWSLYRCSPWSSRPQPLGSGGDTTPCEDTRGDHELSFNFNHQVLLQCVVFKCRCEKCNKDPQ